MVSTAKSFPSVFGEKANISGKTIVVNTTFPALQRGLTATWARLFRSSSRARDLVTREAFHQTLENETRRSDRSGKSFALVLLSGIELVDATDQSLVHRLQSSVCSILRDIDLVGWYEEGATIGIICREIGPDYVAASRAIVTRIHDALSNLEPAHVHSLSVSWHLFLGAARDLKGKKPEMVPSEVGLAEIEPQVSGARDLSSPESMSHFAVTRRELS